MLLYKHRVLEHRQHRPLFFMPAGASMPLRMGNALAAYTEAVRTHLLPWPLEEAAVTAHLLTLRVSGSSRFILLPSHPHLESSEGEAAAEALELRLVLPELLLLGPGEVQPVSKVR